MNFPKAPFLITLPLRELLQQLGDAWPSPDAWPLVPAGTEFVTADTPFTLLSFDRDEAFSDAQRQAFESHLASLGYEGYMSCDQLTDVRDSLGYEIESLTDPNDRAKVQRHHEAILIRAINHYCEMDAFVSLEDWTGAGGKRFKGILADYP